MGETVEKIIVMGDARLVTLVGQRTGARNFALKALAAIASEQIEIFLCQASSQYDVCFAVRPEIVGRITQLLTHETDKHPAQIEASRKVAIISVLGRWLHLTPGVAGRVFGA